MTVRCKYQSKDLQNFQRWFCLEALFEHCPDNIKICHLSQQWPKLMNQLGLRYCWFEKVENSVLYVGCLNSKIAHYLKLKETVILSRINQYFELKLQNIVSHLSKEPLRRLVKHKTQSYRPVSEPSQEDIDFYVQKDQVFFDMDDPEQRELLRRFAKLQAKRDRWAEKN